MSLLQPWAIYALPLLLLPIAIHLIHRRRLRVVEWGAMRFLLAKTRLSRGLQKLRHFLILLCRTVAVLTLVLALGRPMSGGWLGSVAGVGADTVIVILDRSASMATLVQGKSRLETGLVRLVETLEVVRAKKWLILDGATGELVPVASPRDVLQLPAAKPTATHTDLPALFEAAMTKVKEDRGGRAEIWVCSDLQASDWDVDNGRWANIRKDMLAMQGTVGVHLLSFAEPTPANLRVRVLGAEYRKSKDNDKAGGELALDVQVQRDAPTDAVLEVPLTLGFASGRSVVKLELRGSEVRNEGVVVPLPQEAPAGRGAGWGKIELPADDNPMDNVYFLTYGNEPVRRSVVVAEDEDTLRVLALAAEAPLRDGLEYSCTALTMDRAAEMDLSQASLLVWQGPLPPAALRERLDAFVDLGGRVLLLPSKQATTGSYRGLQWDVWLEPGSDQLDAPVTWREDADLVANTGDGKALPLGRVEVYGFRKLVGAGTVLARLRSENPLLMRAPTDRGGVYFLTTTPRPEASNLARHGIVLVAMVQRALEDGVKAMRPGLEAEAGTRLGGLEEWQPAMSYDPLVLSLEKNLYPGVLRRGDRAVAMNRPLSEDAPATLDAARITELFAGVGVTISVNEHGDGGSLVEEVWKLFLLLVAVALIGESVLSLIDMSGRVRA